LPPNFKRAKSLAKDAIEQTVIICLTMTKDFDAADLDEKQQYADSPVDSIPARVVGDWSEDKHYYLGHFIEIFSTGMHKKWPSRAYIDLFAGPGVCMFRKTGRITDGSPCWR
jgi:hypothetical protein